MMARFRCLNCGGEYEQQSPDGVPYYHVCPPLSEPEIEAGVDRSEPRNENVRGGDAEDAHDCLSEGLGRQAVSEAVSAPEESVEPEESEGE